MQVMALTRELAEAQLNGTQARHEAEGLRHLARIVEPEAPSQLAGDDDAQSVQPSSRQSWQERVRPGADAREVLESSYADLEVCTRRPWPLLHCVCIYTVPWAADAC